MNIKTRIIINLIVFVLLLGGAYFVYQSLSVKYVPETQSEPENVNRKVAPNFTVVDVNSYDTELSEFAGKPVVLNFWASWCPPCKTEMPDFEEAYKKYKDDVEFMMVDLVDGTYETFETGKNFIKKSGYTFPVYFDIYQSGAEKYNISGIPHTVFINANGEIVFTYTGAIPGYVLIKNIEKIK
jgi:thiol-disulfide isomerase/thioredoxin